MGPEGIIGRQATEMRRSCTIDTTEKIRLEQNCMTTGVGDFSHGPVSSMNRTYPSDASTACREDIDHWPCKKNIRLLQLDPSIMHERSIEIDLLEYLTPPSLVQRLNPEMWQSAWQHVCSENTFLVMQEQSASDQESGQCPYCTLCSQWGGGATLIVGQVQTKATNPGLCRRWSSARSNFEGRAVHRNSVTLK